MADNYVIELGHGTDGAGSKLGFAAQADDGWMEEALRRAPGSGQVRIRPSDGDDDTEGHRATTTVRVLVDADDDTEGHAISIHFPTIREADAFRRRLLVTGVLVGTVALGTAGGVALSGLGSEGTVGSAAGTATTTPADPRSDIGIMDASGAAAGVALTQSADANTDIGIMDASGAAAAGSTVAVPVDAAGDIGIMDASGALSDDAAPEPAESVVGPR